MKIIINILLIAFIISSIYLICHSIYNRPKYLYVSFTHSHGSGAMTFWCRYGRLNYALAKQTIENDRDSPVDDVVIMNIIEINEEQWNQGLIIKKGQ